MPSPDPNRIRSRTPNRTPEADSNERTYERTNEEVGYLSNRPPLSDAHGGAKTDAAPRGPQRQPRPANAPRPQLVAAARAALAEARATLCGHGIPHNVCKEKHDA